MLQPLLLLSVLIFVLNALTFKVYSHQRTNNNIQSISHHVQYSPQYSQETNSKLTSLLFSDNGLVDYDVSYHHSYFKKNVEFYPLSSLHHENALEELRECFSEGILFIKHDDLPVAASFFQYYSCHLVRSAIVRPCYNHSLRQRPPPLSFIS